MQRLTTPEIRSRAERFVAEWTGHQTRECADAQTFWSDLFDVYGVSRRRVATFEHPIGRGRADLFWPGVLLAESKTPGLSLDKAMEQATGYTRGLDDDVFPRWIVVTDLTRFVVRDLDYDSSIEFAVNELPQRIGALDFLRGSRPDVTVEESVTRKAASSLAGLYTDIVARKYPSDAAETLITRLAWLLFAEDAGILDRHIFRDFVLSTRADGADLGTMLHALFQLIGTPVDERMIGTPTVFESFTHIQGSLFAETLPVPALDSRFRSEVIAASRLDWARVDPAIFGALFEAVLSDDDRRATGSHYTGERDIMRVINPTFLDGLRSELLACGQSRVAVARFRERLGSVKVLDPACGTGNFLTITLRELCCLDIESALITGDTEPVVFPGAVTGIEIQTFAAGLSRLCIEIAYHQARTEAMRAGTGFEWYPSYSLPAEIHCCDALTTDWSDIIGYGSLTAIVGNPPYLGSRGWSTAQRTALKAVYKPLGVKSTGSLDLCAAWVVKAVAALEVNGKIQIGLVTTNSLVQGSQVAPLWDSIHAVCAGTQITWARTSFVWSGGAAVHCILLGLGRSAGKRRLWDGDSDSCVEHDVIGPYLVPGTDVIVRKRRTPWRDDTARMIRGSAPYDGGNLILSRDERDNLLTTHPGVADLIRPFVGGRELLYHDRRWCLWLADVEPTRWSGVPEIKRRVDAVKAMRLASTRPATYSAASQPSKFIENRFVGPCIATSVITSDKREMLVAALIDGVVGSHNKTIFPPSLMTFAIVSSRIHTCWTYNFAGRLGAGIRYSDGICYNTFPFPDPPPAQKLVIETAAQGVLDARAMHPNSCLAELYDPVAMPANLRAAHHALDAAVDRAFRVEPFGTDAERLEFLISRYQALVNGSDD